MKEAIQSTACYSRAGNVLTSFLDGSMYAAKSVTIDKLALAGLLAGIASTSWMGLSAYLVGELAVIPLYVWFIGFGLGIAALHGPLRRNMIESVKTPIFILALAVLCYAGWYAATGASIKDDWSIRCAHLTTGILLFVLAFSVARLRIDSALWIIFTIATATAISGAVAVWQLASGAHPPWSTYARRFDTFDASGQFGRPVGLAWDPVSLGYATVGIAAAAVVMLVAREVKYSQRFIVALAACSIFGWLGLAITASRSGVLGAGVGAAVGVFLIRNHVKRQAIIAATMMASGFVAIAYGPEIVEYVGRREAILSDARIFETWRTYLPAVIAHPFGDPDALVDGQTRLGMVQAASRTAGDLNSYWYILKYAPHNGFLTAGVAFGWLGFAALAGIYFYAIKNCLLIARQQKRGYATIGAALLAATVAILVHGWFHNRSFLVGEIGNWVVLGCIAGIAANIPREKIRGKR